MSRSHTLSDGAFAVAACLAIVLGFAARLTHDSDRDARHAPVADRHVASAAADGPAPPSSIPTITVGLD